MLSENKNVVDLALRINFKYLHDYYLQYCINFICPVGMITSCKVQEAVSSQEAAKTQCGFIVNKIQPLARECTIRVCDLNNY